MGYVEAALDFLECQPDWRYGISTPPATEPTAWAALALAAYGRDAAATRARQWLLATQNDDGSLGVRRGQATPGWPTSLAVLAWTLTADRTLSSNKSAGVSNPQSTQQIEEERLASRRAIEWLISIEGETSERPPYTGHDTTIAGWPWVAGTHSWVEPTAMSLLALRAMGMASNPRARDAALLLDDRLLPSGGCNYGNTIVLGQALLPHVEPTGLALLALAGQPDVDGRIGASLAYLEATLGAETTPLSLAYGLLGLAAHGRSPSEAEAWLSVCMKGAYRLQSTLELALLALAALRERCPLIAISDLHLSA